MRLGTVIVVVVLLATAGSVPAVDYVRLSPQEFAEDLIKASALIESGDYDGAIAVLLTLVEDEPDDADALSLLGYSLRKSGNVARAEGIYRRALEIDPAHLGANQYLGELYAEAGNLEAARERLAILDQLCDASCPGRDALAALIDAAGPR